MPTYSAEFIPQEHLSDEDTSEWIAAMQERQLPAQFVVPLRRRRGHWACALPDIAWGPTGPDFDEAAERSRAEAQRREDVGSYGYVRTRDVFADEQGRWFYRDSALSALAPYLVVPSIAKALVRFLHHLENKRIKPNVVYRDRPPRKPHERVALNGQRMRGPDWTEFEDYVVRKWFSRHTHGEHVGKHVKLTEAQWDSVLAELKGERRKTDVLRRIKELNRRLRESLTVNGYVSRANVLRYKREALGETEVRMPHARPPLRQWHFDGNAN